jgi:integrase/recombinase XerD
MALTLYRFHSKDCEVHSLKLKPNVKRFYNECDCWIWLTGTTDNGDFYPRQTTKLKDWKAAEAYMRSLHAEAKDTAVHGPTIADCITRFLDAHKENVGSRALGQYTLTLGRLQTFASSKGKYHMHELNVDILEDFKTYGLPVLKSTSKSTAVSKLKKFLREAYTRGWTTHALAEKVKSTKAVYEQKQPYTKVEVNAIMEQAEKLNGGTVGFASNGSTFRLLLELMLETGMRVGDAVAYDPCRCAKSKQLWIYSFQPQKQRKNETPKQAEVFLTTRLKRAIDGCKWLSESLPFAYRSPAELGPMAAAVLERMQLVGTKSGVADCRPHRLRDTFAVKMLLAGVALEDVSRLLCHSSIAITEKYYAAWVPSRKLRLEGLVAHAFANPGRD